MKIPTQTFTFLLLVLAALLISPRQPVYALFTVPADERVEGKEGADIAESYSYYTPDTLKLKSHEEVKYFLEGKSAAVVPHKKPTPNINRKQHMPVKDITHAAQGKKAMSSVMSFILMALWVAAIAIMLTCLLLFKIRTYNSTETA